METFVRAQSNSSNAWLCGIIASLSLLATMPVHGQSVTGFTYDAGDHITSITDPRGLATRYTYDGLGQKWQQVSPSTGTTTYNYDGYGRLANITRAGGNQVTYGYDGIGRRISASANGVTQTFTYDVCANGLGRLCSASGANSKTTYVYTPEGWITGRGFAVGATSYSLGYGYNALGQVTTVAYPDGNQAIYSYASGVVSAVQVKVNGVVSYVATNVAYQPNDLAMSQWTSGNGLTSTLTYDTDGRLTGIDVPGIQSLGFSYDAANRITAIGNGADGAMTQTFGYDAMSRLTSVRSSADNEDFAYDADGNRTSQLLNGAGVTVTSNGGNNQIVQLAGASNISYGYDARGNLTTVSGITTFAYDGFNRLSVAAGATYVVGPEGQRLSKSVGGVSTYFANDAAGPLLAELPGSSWSDYVWLNGRLIARINAGQILAVHDDQTGRPEVMTDASKAIVWRARNFAFDRAVTVVNTVPLNLGFPGQYYDAESGLWNNGFRDYSPSLGRYIESDPLDLVVGVNTYAYVGGNPLSYIDPLGLTQWQIGLFMASGGRLHGEFGYAHYIATSECVDNTQGFADGSALFIGGAEGSPINFSGSTFTVDDGIPGNTDPSVLNGLFVYQGAGGSFGAGYGVSRLRLGRAYSDGFSGGSGGGLGYGASSDIGMAHAFTSGQIKCGCQSK